MEIREKIKIKGKEIECAVDTGADYTILKEDLIRELGLKPKGKIKVSFAKEKIAERNYYVTDVEINGCKIPLAIIIEGKKNLLGHDLLQKLGAIIDEKEGKIIYRICPSPIPSV